MLINVYFFNTSKPSCMTMFCGDPCDSSVCNKTMRLLIKSILEFTFVSQFSSCERMEAMEGGRISRCRKQMVEAYDSAVACKSKSTSCFNEPEIMVSSYANCSLEKSLTKMKTNQCTVIPR